MLIFMDIGQLYGVMGFEVKSLLLWEIRVGGVMVLELFLVL